MRRKYSASHANRGRTLEDFLEFANNQYRNLGQALITKQHTKFIPIRNSKGRVATVKVEEKATVDYMGRYKNIPIALEAKHTKGKRMSFSQVQDHQAAYLDDWTKEEGAIALVLISYGLTKFYAIPWPFWKAARDAWENKKEKTKAEKITVEAYGWKWTTTGMASASPEELLDDWEVKPGGRTGLPYLEIIEKIEKQEARL